MYMRDANVTPIIDAGYSMLTRGLLFRIAGPTLFVSLLFLGSCITAALYLHHQQSASLRVLDENLWSRRIAADLLRALDDLAALPGDRAAEVDALQERIGELLAQARQFADQREEAGIVSRLEGSFGRYHLLRRQADAQPADNSGDGSRQALTL